MKLVQREAVAKARTLAPRNSLTETSIFSLLRASLLRCTRDLHAVQDQIDCAELLVLAELNDLARTLYNITFLRLGFGEFGVKKQAEIALRTRLWKEAEWVRSPIPPVSQFGHPFAIAIGELKQIVNSQTGRGSVSARAADTGEPFVRPSASMPAASRNEVGAFCGQICKVLRDPLCDGSREELGRLLTWIQQEVLSRRSFDIENHLDEIPLIADCLAFNSLRSFFLSNYDLAYPPFGSLDLFHQTARLDAAGLGAYLTNMTQLTDNCRDIFGMIQLAVDPRTDATVPRDVLERWSVLLSQHLHGSLLHGLLEELADFGLMGAIWRIYARIVRQSEVCPDLGILWCIRDCGLDNGDVSLALAAQKEVLRWSPHSTIEWNVLGEIEATYGQMEEANASFLEALRIEPGNKAARARLAALQTGRFERFAINGGLGSSRTRKLLRSARQQALGQQ